MNGFRQMNEHEKAQVERFYDTYDIKYPDELLERECFLYKKLTENHDIYEGKIESLKNENKKIKGWLKVDLTPQNIAYFGGSFAAVFFSLLLIFGLFEDSSKQELIDENLNLSNQISEVRKEMKSEVNKLQKEIEYLKTTPNGKLTEENKKLLNKIGNLENTLDLYLKGFIGIGIITFIILGYFTWRYFND